MKRLYEWFIDLFKVYRLEITIYCHMTRRHQDILHNYLLTDGRKIWVDFHHSVTAKGPETQVTVHIRGRKKYDWAQWQFLVAVRVIDKLLQEESKEAS